MAGLMHQDGLVLYLDEAVDAYTEVGLFTNSSAPANFAAITEPDDDNGYASQAITGASWNAAAWSTDHAYVELDVTFQHDGTGNFLTTSPAADPCPIYGVYLSDGTDIAYCVFADGPINIGPSYKDGRNITLRFKAANTGVL